MFRQADVFGRQAARDEILKTCQPVSGTNRPMDTVLDVEMNPDMLEFDCDDGAADTDFVDNTDQQHAVAADPLTTEEFEIILAWRALTGAISDATLANLCDDFSYINLNVNKRSIKNIQRDLIRSSQLTSFQLCYPCCRTDCKEHPRDYTVVTVNIESQLKIIASRYKDYINDSMVLVMNTDGIRPRDHVKLSVWPIFFYVHSLPLHLRGLKENCVIGALISGPSSPSIEIVEFASRHFKQLLPHGRIRVWHGEQLAEISVDLEHVIMDIPATSLTYTTANHASLDPACIKCPARPEYIDHAPRYRLIATAPERADTDYNPSIQRKTIFFDLAPLGNVRFDYLHGVDEGINKMLLGRLYSDGKSDLYLGRYGSLLLEAYSSSGGRLVSDEKHYADRLSLLSGHERRFVFHDTFPLACVQLWNSGNSIHRVLAALTAYWACCRLLISNYGDGYLEDISQVIEMIGIELEQLGPRFRTLKAHMFFVHSPSEMRKTQQPLTHFTAAVFEAFNLDIQRNVDPHHTSGFNEGMVSKHILRSATRHYIDEYHGSATFQCWWKNQQKDPSQWVVLPQTQIHKIQAKLAVMTSKYRQLLNIVVLKSIRIVADIVQVTDSPYHVKVKNGKSWSVVKPAFAFLHNNKPYLYGYPVQVSNPFANLRLENDQTLDFLEKIKHFPKFCYILETDELEPPNQEHYVYDCDNVVAYLFSMKVSNIDYLIEGTECVARL